MTWCQGRGLKSGPATRSASDLPIACQKRPTCIFTACTSRPGNADNVFLEIPPGEDQVYEFSLPRDHRGGTYWYHPHVHHLVARQLWAGLAGLLIVRGELDDIPEIRDADEEFLVLKDFGLDANGDLLTPDPTPQIMQGRQGDLA
jgi:FtsP/CotA-like multicopper oxidase with cupredoxin domain